MTTDYDIMKWLWFATACIPGSSYAGKLLSSFDSAEDVYDYDFAVSNDFEHLPPNVLSALSQKSLSTAQKLYEYCDEHDIGLLPYCDRRYPAKLRMIKHPPALLYYIGRLPDFGNYVTIASVGTRSCTEYGLKAAERICYDLARAGVAVVSGMALGVDAASHIAALNANGLTIAVLGSGVDVIYPRGNEELYHQICRNGLVLSEYPPLSSASKTTFPERNRIISGLCNGVLVVEADQKSGALITAKDALFQGRDLFAVPGNIFSPTSAGTNQLVQDGAKLVTDAYDILVEYQDIHGDKLILGSARTAPALSLKPAKAASSQKIKTTPQDKNKKIKQVLLSENEKAVFNTLSPMPMSADAIAQVCALPTGKVVSILMALEIKQLVKELPGGQYIKTH